MNRCLDCSHRTYILGKSGCMEHGHTITNLYDSCEDFICEFCECEVCSCGDEDIEE